MTQYNGTAAAEKIIGSESDDFINGNGGGDLLLGDMGNDYITGGSGLNSIYGGMGNDTVVSGPGNAFLSGNIGNDRLYGGKGSDTIYGGKGDDFLFGGQGTNVLHGDIGNDTAGYSGKRADYTITQNSDGSFQIVGDGSTDTVFTVENFQFADQTVTAANLLNGTPTGGGGGGSTPTPTPVSPTITGAHTTNDTNEATVQPFGTLKEEGPVTIQDSNKGATDSATITIVGAGGKLSGEGLTQSEDGSYSLAATTPDALSKEIDALKFTPNGTPGETTKTTFGLTVKSSAGTTATDSGTVVSDTADAPVVAPTISNTHETLDFNNFPVQPFGNNSGQGPLLFEVKDAAPTSNAVVVGDANPGATDSATIVITGSGGSLTGDGLIQNENGSYSLEMTSPSALSSELDALTFIPNGPGTATFSLAVLSSAGTSASDSNTKVNTLPFNIG